jgi:hypothetical protein
MRYALHILRFSNRWLGAGFDCHAKFLKTADANPPGMFRLKRDDRSQGSHQPPYNGWPNIVARWRGEPISSIEGGADRSYLYFFGLLSTRVGKTIEWTLAICRPHQTCLR